MTREQEGARAAAGTSSPRAAPAAGPTTGQRRSRPILVVDDDPGTLAFVVRALRAHGHEVRTAGGGREALLAVYGGGPVPAVLLADVDMPGMSGIELAARLAADRPGVAIVLMSEDPVVLAMARNRPELVRGVLAKPLTADAVVGIVGKLVGEPGADAAPSADDAGTGD